MYFSPVTYSYQILLQSSYGILLDMFTQYVIYSENMDEQIKNENESERDSAETEPPRQRQIKDWRSRCLCAWAGLVHFGCPKKKSQPSHD